MIRVIKRWVAAYDRWCERMGLVPENRRCCAPVRYDEDDPRHPDQRRTACRGGTMPSHAGDTDIGADANANVNAGIGSKDCDQPVTHINSAKSDANG